MKPKHKIFCIGCNRSKILFDSEGAAKRFIEFNVNEFDGKAPTRAYYCKFCCGWHVTSRSEDIATHYEQKDEAVIDALLLSQKKSNKLMSQEDKDLVATLNPVTSKLGTARIEMLRLNPENAQSILDACYEELMDLEPRFLDYPNCQQRYNECSQKYEAYLKLLESLRLVMRLSESQLDELQLTHSNPKNMTELEKMIANRRTSLKIERKIANARILIENHEIDKAKVEISEAEDLADYHFAGAGNKDLKKFYKTEIQSIKGILINEKPV